MCLVCLHSLIIFLVDVLFCWKTNFRVNLIIFLWDRWTITRRHRLLGLKTQANFSTVSHSFKIKGEEKWEPLGREDKNVHNFSSLQVGYKISWQWRQITNCLFGKLVSTEAAQSGWVLWLRTIQIISQQALLLKRLFGYNS